MSQQITLRQALQRDGRATRLPMVPIQQLVCSAALTCLFIASALWSSPRGPDWLGTNQGFDALMMLGMVSCGSMALFGRTRLRVTVTAGAITGVICAFRSVTILAARDVFGTVAYAGAANWAVFTVVAVTTMMTSAQYILVSRSLTSEERNPVKDYIDEVDRSIGRDALWSQRQEPEAEGAVDE